MKNFRIMLTAALLALLSSQAPAAVVCNSCDYITTGGSVGTFLGTHSPLTEDNSTFSNATTGQNGSFSNWWGFRIDPAGDASVNAIFLPISNIENFDVALYEITGQTCDGPTPTAGGACTLLTAGALVADGFTSPAYATVVDFTTLEAGLYAFNVTGTIKNLGETQPASYTGNLQVTASAVPEPGSLALAGVGLLGLGGFLRRKNGR